MKTTLLTPETDENAVKTAAALIRQGEVVGMPTETVYGLAANALDGVTHLLANVEQCRFTIDTPLCDGQRFAVTWTMHWSHPRIAGGETLALPGCSVVDIAGEQVLHQRDYYDAGEMIYEHLPLLGWAVRGVKRRVRS